MVVSAELKVSSATKAAMRDDDVLQTFVKHCCRFSLYAIQIKKCGDANCSICGPTKMQTEDFKRRVHWLPLPTLKPPAAATVTGPLDVDAVADPEWYSFEDLYGCMETNESS